MRFRLPATLVALAMAVAGSLAVAAPAHAAATDPVTGLTVTAQKQGANQGDRQTWEITATWEANPDATKYQVSVAGDEHGDDVYLPPRDVTTTTTSLTLTTDGFLEGEEYWIVVRTKTGGTPALGDLASTSFTTIALDRAGPTGAVKADRTTGYLVLDMDAPMEFRGAPGLRAAESLFDDLLSARFTLTLSGVTDANPPIKREILAGDGSAAKPWTSGSYSLTYTKAGTYTPHVLLTDKAGNVTDIAVTLRVLADNGKPKVRITKPKKPAKAASWKRVTGTATDSATEVVLGMAVVAQKRGSIWHVYDFGKRKWLPGTTSYKKSMKKSKAEAALVLPKAGGAWRTPKIRGMARGELRIQVAAVDAALNVGGAKAKQRIR